MKASGLTQTIVMTTRREDSRVAETRTNSPVYGARFGRQAFH